LIGHLQVANKCGVALATLTAASSGPIPKAPGFAGGYLQLIWGKWEQKYFSEKQK
jgi:hypothetical protein